MHLVIKLLTIISRKNHENTKNYRNADIYYCSNIERHLVRLENVGGIVPRIYWEQFRTEKQLKTYTMTYQDYIDLGFKRVDLDDSVEVSETGYPGFSLTKKLTKDVSIEVYWRELEFPALYIRKKRSETYYITPITEEICKTLSQQFANSGE